MREGISILIVSVLVLSVLGMTLAIATETNPPSVTNPEASPSIIANDGNEYTELTVDVIDDTAIYNVTVDLNPIGGNVVYMTCKANYTKNDKIISVFNYTTNATCSLGTYNLVVNATDNATINKPNYNDTESISLGIWICGDVTGDGWILTDDGDLVYYVAGDAIGVDALTTEWAADVTGNGWILTDDGDLIYYVAAGLVSESNLNCRC
jgi:hypothetical protein